MFSLRIAVFVILFAFFLLDAAGNAALVAMRKRPGRRPSLVPILGGVAGAIALLVAPWAKLHLWCWVPLVLDLGCAPLLLAALIGRRT